ncbi:MAG: DUF445 domain-containing protein [Gammaproteobacteria bacterium]
MKHWLTHGIGIGCVGIGYVLNEPYTLNVGLFSLSGSITNDLAIYMLFEKVPGLYGSGVIPERFEEFKAGIYHLVMTQFFNQQNLSRFFDEQSSHMMHFDDMIESVDISHSFDAFVEVILNSQFGAMINMVGGAKVLDTFREPFLLKLRTEMKSIANGESFQEAVQAKMRASMDSGAMHEKVSHIIQTRLDELTPQMVKKIVEEMIRKHLGWLVVWGGVFGGLIGLIATGISKYVV